MFPSSFSSYSSLLRTFLLLPSISTSTLDFLNQSAQGHANIGAPRQLTKSPACSFAKSAVSNASVFLLGLMLTRRFAPATTTGKPREEDPNALELITLLHFLFPDFLKFG